ncbi:hypothetical protein ACFWN2_41395 [Lentzea sp. NPDC058436]|uniref:hypothetical protein n=1 Tax=Lentzea sp. NPDC058436 TaxID=3346499 RepID=UPI00365F8D1C
MALGDIRIEVTGAADLGEVARLIAAARDDGPVPPRLRELVDIVGEDAGPDELETRAAKDAEFTALLHEVLRESRKGGKKRTTIVVVAVLLVTAGTLGAITLLPGRTPEPPSENRHSAVVTTPPPDTGTGAPTGSGAPLVPPLIPSSRTTPPTATSTSTPTKTPEPRSSLATTASQTRGLPGTSVNFYGTGYNACPGSRTVNVLWDGAVVESAVPVEQDGRFGVRVTVPESASTGDHQLAGQCAGDSALTGRTTFTVSPPLVVTASPNKLRSGQVLSVRGRNYDGCPDYGTRSVSVSISAMGLSTTAPIKADGTFDAQFTIPPGTGANDYDVVGQCQDGGQWARGIFTVLP